MDDVADIERGLDACRDELAVMHGMANRSQKSIFAQITTELELNSTAVVSGAAGTGKSFVLRMLERHYKLEGFKVTITQKKKISKENVTHHFCILYNVRFLS